MDYHLERLGDDRFQKLCQALLTAQFPKLQCFPINQSDGGRDAISRNQTGGFIAFQVKYSNQPALASERDAVLALIRTEKQKIERLKAAGATSYYFLTNVSGTAVPDVGSIDRVNEVLTEEFGLPAYCWWRDDIDRRIDATDAVKWSYPEILRGTDVLQMLITGRVQGRPQLHTVLRAYLTSQYANDEEVKFKQVELQNKLLKLFVDVPGLFRDEEHGTVHFTIDTSDADFFSAPHRQDYGASRLLLEDSKESGVSRIVLEGAPGQGKSTITQYIAQVHRMHFLGKAHDLEKVAPAHRNCRARIPIRVDIRDYSYWIAGRNPFSAGDSEKLPTDTPKGLETFLAAHIKHGAGGLSFEADDLSEVMRGSHVLIILDGFDEVADVSLREDLVREITRASVRMETQSASLQIVVTSRPSAFANSPGFPKREWRHLELRALSQTAIQAYAANWMAARGLAERERVEFNLVLRDRLEQAHIRDLARNPMQLAILLSLINTKGLSLPDKRTALYDAYVDLFFSREAEKNVTVRDHRDLLIVLHRYLAWLLQTEAESLQSRGSIDATRLKAVVRTYLSDQGYDVSLADVLFTGMIERVVALVSRQIGTYEFEVQPLREYFAARYLYETAKYAPATKAQQGTKPDRFRALAKNFYWLNVTRFYAGCYSAGELSSLVDGIQELTEDPQYSNLVHPRSLAFMLLGDWVFSQQPHVVRRLVDLLVQPGNLRLLMAEHGRYDRAPGLLPKSSGRAQFADGLKKAITNATMSDYRSRLTRSLVVNSTQEDRMEWWVSTEPETRRYAWWSLGAQLEVLDVAPAEVLTGLVQKHGSSAVSAVLGSARPWVLHSAPDAIANALETALDANLFFSPPPAASGDEEFNVAQALGVLAYLPTAIVRIKNSSPMAPFGETLKTYVRDRPISSSPQPLPEDSNKEKLKLLARSYARLCETPLVRLQESLDDWDQVVEPIRSEFGERRAVQRLAIAAAGATQRDIMKGLSLLDGNAPICRRAHAARRMTVRGWQKCLDQATGVDDLRFAVALAFCWGSTKLTESLAEHLSPRLKEMEASDWDALFDFLSYSIAIARNDTMRKESAELASRELHPRAAALLAIRSSQPRRATLHKAFLADYRQDKNVRRLAAEISVERALRHPTAWTRACEAMHEEYQDGFVAEHWIIRSYGQYSRTHLPIRWAEKIASRADQYPLEMLYLASNVLTARAGREVPQVAQVASMEKWDG